MELIIKKFIVKLSFYLIATVTDGVKILNIMIIEDESAISDVLESYFLNEGWKTISCKDGKEAIQKIGMQKLDLVILDLMLPGLPGEEVCRAIRQQSNVPIIMLTSKANEVDTINGLNLGADDYITKPFRMKEVIARIYALQRRMNMLTHVSEPLVTFNGGKMIINFETKEVMVDRKAANLTFTEFKLLNVLIKRPGKIYTRSDLSYEVLGYRFIGDGRTLDMHIKNIRRKIEEDPKNPIYIVTKVGEGYKFGFQMDGEA